MAVIVDDIEVRHRGVTFHLLGLVLKLVQSHFSGVCINP